MCSLNPTFQFRFQEENTNSLLLENRVFSVLLGDVVPTELEGTTDNNYYNHYSEISTVEANWYI